MSNKSDDFNNLGVWLPKQLAAVKLSPEQLANKINLSRAAVYFWMDDTTRPTRNTMAKVCHALGVPLEEGLKQYTERKNGRPSTSR